MYRANGFGGGGQVKEGARRKKCGDANVAALLLTALYELKFECLLLLRSSAT